MKSFKPYKPILYLNHWDYNNKKLVKIIGKENVIRFSPGPYQVAGIPDLLILEADQTNNYWIEIKMNNLIIWMRFINWLQIWAEPDIFSPGIMMQM